MGTLVLISALALDFLASGQSSAEAPNYSFKGNNHRTDVCPLNSGVRPQTMGTPPLSIFVPLVGEGTAVWRPAIAALVAPGRYELLGKPAADETWLFETGQVLVCEHKTFADGTSGLVAVRAAT